MEIKKALFLTHRHALYSEITGGVQLCSQEFHEILNKIPSIALEEYYVPYTKNILQRVQMKLGLENYSMFNTRKDASALVAHIVAQDIKIVFINMASLVRYAKPIREAVGNKVKIVLLSHGNHSGDFLHLITKPIHSQNIFRKLLNKIRLGLLVATEAEHRERYLNAVVALSETEQQIENWFGAKISVFASRRLQQDFLNHQPIPGRVGFVGRLDHPPNLQGMQILLEAIKGVDHHSIKIILVGAPPEYGRQLKDAFPFIEYLGELSDIELRKEVSSWSFLLNPVWWYSTGASTKLAKAISWGIPIITTTAGMRGYSWKQGSLLVKDTPNSMAAAMLQEGNDSSKIAFWAEQTKIVANSGLSDTELSQLIQKSIE